MGLSIGKIEEIAPDQGSLDAARKLLKPQGWPTIAGDGAGLIWGECQGSGALPYRVVVSETDLGYKCTCPSRKFPCKHTLALMWMRAENRPFTRAEPPDWVTDWLVRRRGPFAAKPAADAADRPKASVAASAEAEADAAAPDPKAEARAAAQRERNRAEREASILGGLDDLDRWLLDQAERGLAAFPAVAHDQCRLLARRLVDAKANGLAARVERLPAALFALAEGTRGAFLIERFGELHLIAEAYRRQNGLPEALRADVRLAVGWPQTKEALLADPLAVRRRARWMVIATVNEVQPDKLRRIETWLACLAADAGPAFAVLIDFVPVSAGGVGNTYAPGEIFEAELTFYPSAAPLRAVIAEQMGAAVRTDGWPGERPSLGEAMAAYDTALAARPWLEDWPLAARGVALRHGPGGLVLADAAGEIGLPLTNREDDMALPLVGAGELEVFGLWDGRALDLKFAQTPLGRWVGS